MRIYRRPIRESITYGSIQDSNCVLGRSPFTVGGLRYGCHAVHVQANNGLGVRGKLEVPLLLVKCRPIGRSRLKRLYEREAGERAIWSAREEIESSGGVRRRAGSKPPCTFTLESGEFLGPPFGISFRLPRLELKQFMAKS